MALNVAFQMDHISTLQISGDSTFALMLEAERRGHVLYHYTPDRLALYGKCVMAAIEPVSVRDIFGDHYTLGPAERTDLSILDAVFLRQDPPFDMNYISTTHFLERIHPQTQVVNNPASVRNAPEKILVTEFTDLMPPTLITCDVNEIKSFREDFKDIVIKPLYGNGGKAVFRLREGDENFGSLIGLFSDHFHEPWVIQKYLPEVREGDKRIILVDGVYAGAINRIPADDDLRSNMVQGAKAVLTDLSPREHEICEAIGPLLKEQGLLFVGIDVIGGYLTEINVTSPTGIRAVKALGGTDIAALIWDKIEALM